MTNGIQNELPIMVIAIILSVGIMMIFMKPVSSFIQKQRHKYFQYFHS